MYPVSNSSKDFLQRMREKYDDFHTTFDNNEPSKGYMNLSFNQFRYRKQTIDRQCGELPAVVRDARLNKELPQLEKLENRESCKDRLIEAFLKQPICPLEIPLPSQWTPDQPITAEATKLYNLPVRPMHYGNTFYRDVQSKLSLLVDGLFAVEYPGPNHYQNRLIYNDLNKKMVVVKTNTNRRWSIADIMGVYRQNIPTTFHTPHYKLVTLCIHAASAPLVVSDRTTAITVPIKRTIAIDIAEHWSEEEIEKINDIHISSPAKVAVFAVEFLLQDDVPNPFFQLTHLRINSDFQVSERLVAQRQSFIRKSLSQKEIQHRLRFLDAEFVKDKDDHFHVASITLLNYFGKVLMNTRVRSRTRVDDWATRCHGLEDKDLIGRADEYEVITELHKNLYGNILVGHDLQMEIIGMAIPTHTLLGIRDTAAAKVFEKMGIKKKKNGNFYSLRALAWEVLQLSIQQHYHSAWEDTVALLRIYHKVENQWEDNMSPGVASKLFENSPPQTNGPPSSTAGEWLEANYWQMAKNFPDASSVTSFHSAHEFIEREDDGYLDDNVDLFAPLDDFDNNEEYDLPPPNDEEHPVYVPTVEEEMPPPPRPEQIKVLTTPRRSVLERLTPKVVEETLEEPRMVKVKRWSHGVLGRHPEKIARIVEPTEVQSTSFNIIRPSEVSIHPLQRLETPPHQDQSISIVKGNRNFHCDADYTRYCLWYRRQKGGSHATPPPLQKVDIDEEYRSTPRDTDLPWFSPSRVKAEPTVPQDLFADLPIELSDDDDEDIL